MYIHYYYSDKMASLQYSKDSLKATKEYLSGLRRKKKEKINYIVDVGSKFTEAIKNTPYDMILEDEFEYEIFQGSTGKGVHWLLVVRKCSKTGKLPYIGIEITTNKSGILIPTMRELPSLFGTDDGLPASHIAYLRKAAQDNSLAACLRDMLGLHVSGHKESGADEILLQFADINLTKKGTKCISIWDLCTMADSACHEMGTYNLRKRNCQHFCNKVLKNLGMEPTKTTIGTDISSKTHKAESEPESEPEDDLELQPYDHFNQVFCKVKSESVDTKG